MSKNKFCPLCNVNIEYHDKVKECLVRDLVDEKIVLIEAIMELCKSMHPHPNVHPAMYKAKENGLKILKDFSSK